jgi:hypothetical protein
MEIPRCAAQWYLDTALWGLVQDHDPVLCGIVQDHNPVLCDIVQDHNPVLCGIVQDHDSVLCGISVVDPKLFFSDPDPIFRRALDPDPDPTWLLKSFGSGFGSDPKHSLFHIANDLKWLFIDFKAYFSKKMLD